MLQTLELAQTSWRDGAFRAGPGHLIFGQTYEDLRIELEAISARSRVFAIAGAGSTAQVLAAAGHRVTAVDINAAQLDYARALSEGAPPRAGLAERALGAGRKVAALCGWTRKKLDLFLNMSHCAKQVEYWDRELDTPAFRALADTVLAPRMLRFCYRGRFVRWLPRGFGSLMRARLRRGWASHSNCSNPYAALLLRGRTIDRDAEPQSAINYVCADAAAFLESCAPGSFDAFALSNIGDGAPGKYLERLAAAVAHAGSPQAIAVWRSFAEPHAGLCGNQADADRSLVWGIVRAGRVSDFQSELESNSVNGGPPCCIG
jgi:hypothetical protein